MNYFTYKGNNLFVEDVDINNLVKKYKTPFYCYSQSFIEDKYNEYDSNLKLSNKLIAFAVKSNSNLSILNILAKLGAGVDVVSKGEIMRSIKAGVNPQKIVFSGVGKSEEEILCALENNILQFNIESINELKKINDIAKNINKQAKISIRVNPNVDAHTLDKISTGRKTDKFGIDIMNLNDIINLLPVLTNSELIGISCHIGSQILTKEPYIKSYNIIKTLLKDLLSRGLKIKTCDLGGGLGVQYNNENIVEISEYTEIINNLFAEFQDIKFIIEPGRSIVANAGILVTKILYKKLMNHHQDQNQDLINQNQDQDPINDLLIVDAGMNDFMRTALYGAEHQIIPLEKKNNIKEDSNLTQNSKRSNQKKKAYNVVGPICETSDKFVTHAEFSSIEEEDYLALLSVGAYGMTLANEYNSRKMPNEILVKKQKFDVIRLNPTIEDILNRDIIVTL